VLHDGVVEVEPADVLQALLGQHVEPGLGAAHHGGVERAAAEVVDGQAPPDRHLGAVHRGEVRRRADRLRDQPRRAEPGVAGRLDQGAAALLAPAGRVGQADLLRRRPELAAGLGGDLAEHQAEHLRDRHLPVAEEDVPVVDAPLRVGLEAAGVQPGVPLGVAADEHPAVGPEIHRGRQQW
jgi:hypothetical protein